MNFLARKNSEEDKILLDSVKDAFIKVKSEMDDHLLSINENTQDVQELNENLSELDHKINKLTERLDEIELLINPRFKMTNVQLSKREQEVFVGICAEKSISLASLAKRLGFTTDMVSMYIINMLGKGVPIRKELVDDLLVFSIEPEFKDMQSRRNILNLDTKVAPQTAERDV